MLGKKIKRYAKIFAAILVADILFFIALDRILLAMFPAKIAATRFVRYQVQTYAADPRVREMKAMLPFIKPEPNLRAKGTTLLKPENYEWSFSTNSMGLRGAEPPPASGDRDINILCIGDSRTFGEGVNDDETYPARLGVLLKAARPDLNFRIFNAGAPGMTSVEAVDLFKRKWSSEPINVMVVWLGINDYYKASATVMNQTSPNAYAIRKFLGMWNLYLVLDSAVHPVEQQAGFFEKGVVNPQGYELGKKTFIYNITELARMVADQNISGPKAFIVIADPIPYENPGIAYLRTLYPALEYLYGMDVLDAEEIFKQHKPTPEELENFDSRLDWTKKILKILKIDPKYRDEIFPHYYLFIDPINHPNATGQLLISNGLKDKILRVLPQ